MKNLKNSERQLCEHGASGFTLMEVLVAFAIVATAFIAVVGLQIDSLRTMERLTQKIEANLWADDAYTRYVLIERGYNIERVHPLMQEKRPDWEEATQMEPLDLDDLPFMPVLPTGWQADWVAVEIKNEHGEVLSVLRPLWVRSDNQDITSESPGGIGSQVTDTARQ